MINDRVIFITVGSNRKSTNWIPQRLLVSELWEKLKNPVRGTETISEYLNMKKSQQDELKDVGGYVGGTLNSPRRKASTVTGRDIVTLDLDCIPPFATDNVLKRIDSLGCGYCVYSTRKHQPHAPRLRVLIPLDRTATVEEYEPLARKIAEIIGINMADPSTFEASRLMYWPSCSADGVYIYQTADKPFASVDGILALYANWRDVQSWPHLPGVTTYKKLAVKQGDPEAKTGLVGAFCKMYDVRSAMDTFLQGIYDPVLGDPNRYTYLEGSTTGGAIVYEDGKFLYSHHATDPCHGRLVNAFDLVRLHRFSDLDDSADEDTPTNRLPSFEAMRNMVANLPEVVAVLSKEREESFKEEFKDVITEEKSKQQKSIQNVQVDAKTTQVAISETNEEDTGWEQKLAINPRTLTPQPTIDNVCIILENDPHLKNKFALNLFAGRGEVLDKLPWDSSNKRRYWTDNDNSGLYWYMEKRHRIVGTNKIDSALSLHSNKFAFNEVQEFITKLKWDGVKRLDTLFVDYLGAEDTPYVRTVARKGLVAAIARALTPGCKFDNMIILVGRQGIGKSTLLDTLSKGWFNDSIRSFEGKEASELLQGVWIVEISELDAFRRTDVARIKQFLSLRADRFRAAYGKHVKEIPRSCVFFGTTNTWEFLQDTTGNRRFWPVVTGRNKPTKSIWKDLPNEVAQIWAEAYSYWMLGENLFLSGDIEIDSHKHQEEHREAYVYEGIIKDFVNKRVPEDWNKWSQDKRMMYWSGSLQEDLKLVPRSQICVMEVWIECLKGIPSGLNRNTSRDINNCIANLEGWGRAPKVLRCGPYGPQRCFLSENRSNMDG